MERVVKPAKEYNFPFQSKNFLQSLLSYFVVKSLHFLKESKHFSLSFLYYETKKSRKIAEDIAVSLWHLYLIILGFDIGTFDVFDNMYRVLKCENIRKVKYICELYHKKAQSLLISKI